MWKNLHIQNSEKKNYEKQSTQSLHLNASTAKYICLHQYMQILSQKITLYPNNLPPSSDPGTLSLRLIYKADFVIKQ